MNLLTEIMATTFIAFFLVAFFGWTLFIVGRYGKEFGCTTTGDGEDLCAICPGRGIRCTIKRKLGALETKRGAE